MKEKTKQAGWLVKETGNIVVPDCIQKHFTLYGSCYKNGLSTIFIKPDAQVALDNGAPNRDFRDRKIDGYKSSINHNKWIRESGVSLCFNSKGRLIDGQSRLKAFIDSNSDVMEFDVAINVSDEMVECYTDEKEQNRTSKDRAQRIVRTILGRDLFPREENILQQALIYSAVNNTTRINRMGRIKAQQYREIYTDPSLPAIINNVFQIMDSLNVPKSEKKCNALWGCVLRAYTYFEREDRLQDIERFLVLVFNSRANEENEYDGWAKLTCEVIHKYSRSGWAEVYSFYDTLNKYLYNYYKKTPCPKNVRSGYIRAKNRTEHFLFDNEMDSISIEQELVIEREPALI
jgi:hypothetical protein